MMIAFLANLKKFNKMCKRGRKRIKSNIIAKARVVANILPFSNEFQSSGFHLSIEIIP